MVHADTKGEETLTFVILVAQNVLNSSIASMS